MTTSVCGYCGYSRSVQVAGCDHATLPTAGEEMANAFRAMEPPRVGPHLQALIEHMSAHEEPDCPQDDTCECADVANINAACAAIEALAERTYDERAAAEAALAAEREKSALLAAELVELQCQVVGRDEALVVLGTELEQERRECGRLRADLESARQLLDGEGGR